MIYYQIFTVTDGVRDLVKEEPYAEDAYDAAVHEHFCTDLMVVVDEVKLNDRCQLIRRKENAMRLYLDSNEATDHGT